ncbi:MAG: matrixin family metalloprotease [Acidobacteriota bacterium]
MRRWRSVSWLGAAALVVLVCGDASAYKYQGVRWTALYENYYVNNAAASWLSKIKAGMNPWNNAGSKFKFVYKGKTSKGVSWNVSDVDYTNVITKGPLSGSQYQNVLALNHSWYYQTTKRLVDSDIIFNTNFPWVTNGSPSGYDVQNILTHEAGHSLQLLDLYGAADKEKTMYGYGAKGETKKRTLHSDDIAGIKKIYGAK